MRRIRKHIVPEIVLKVRTYAFVPGLIQALGRATFGAALVSPWRSQCHVFSQYRSLYYVIHGDLKSMSRFVPEFANASALLSW